MNTAAEPTEKTAPVAGWGRFVLGRHPRRTMLRILVLVATCAVVFNFVLQPIRVTGHSMSPTYKDRSINFVNLLSYRSHLPQRGDVVSVKLPGGIYYLKRVVGLPGETVSIINGDVWIDGEKLEEPYVKLRGPQTTYRPYLLEPDNYCLAGDNRNITVIGATHRTNILGKVIY